MIRRTLFTLGFAVSVTASGGAQVIGLPVINNGAPVGISLGADVGFANDLYYGGGGTAFGGHASLGLGFFGVSGMISHFSPKVGEAVWSPGASATLRLIGGPLVPFRITMQAGAGRWSEGGVSFTHVPLSLGLAATIPNPAFSIKPWIAPRIDVQHSSGTSIEGGSISSTDVHFGISGGIDLGLLNGMAIRAAYDRLTADGAHPGVFSLGLGFSP
jgi:hypothetical protein